MKCFLTHIRSIFFEFMMFSRILGYFPTVPFSNRFFHRHKFDPLMTKKYTKDDFQITIGFL